MGSRTSRCEGWCAGPTPRPRDEGCSTRADAAGYRLRVVPPGWTRDWGPAREPTLAVYIAGEGVVESSDGDRRRVRPGVILLAEDTTGRGHRAEVAGGEPLVVLHVVLPTLAGR